MRGITLRGDWERVRAFLTPVTDSGHLGVDLFYVISGFVITLTYVEKMGRRPRLAGWVSFWWARIHGTCANEYAAKVAAQSQQAE